MGCPVGTYKSPTSSECEPCPKGQYSEGGYPYPKKCDFCPKGTSTPGRGSYSIDQCGEQKRAPQQQQWQQQQWQQQQRQQQQQHGSRTSGDSSRQRCSSSSTCFARVPCALLQCQNGGQPQQRQLC
jgi:hypothetical protein